MSKPKLPTPGASGIQGSGDSNPVGEVARPARRRVRSDERRLAANALRARGRADEAREIERRGGRRADLRGDPIGAAIEAGDVRTVSGPAPGPGMAPTQRHIGEQIIRNTRPSERGSARWVSVDGIEYVVDVAMPKDPKKRRAVFVNNTLQCLLHALREQVLGGDPFDVFNAFNTKLSDKHGRVLFPLSEETIRALSEIDEDDDDVPFDEENPFSVEESPEEAFEGSLGAPGLNLVDED